MVSLSNAIIFGFTGNDSFYKNHKERLSLMARCAIDSNATIGFNLPLIDPKKPDNGNYYVAIMHEFKNNDISSKEVEEVLKTLKKKEVKIITNEYGDNGKNLMKNFRQHMNSLFDDILKEAEEIKKDEGKK
jgi:hypothetical protein